MARRLAYITIECTTCGNRAKIDGAELESRLDEPLTFDTLGQVVRRLVCRPCRGRSVRIYDDAGRKLVDPATTTHCRSCGDPILLPRLHAVPDTTLCARCAAEANAPRQPAPHPQPPPDKARCPRCARPTVVRENSTDASYFLGCTGFPQCRWTEPFERPA